MLSKLIVSAYGMFIEIAIWLVLAGSLIGGWQVGGFWAGIGVLIGAFVACVVIFGVLLVLVDIQKTVRAIESRGDSRGGNGQPG